ncbi:MAG: hypothetical protein ABSH30_04310 [Acidimicrobiales bacterium]
MVPAVRLRQVVLITPDLRAVTDRLETELGLAPGFRDEGVGVFGLENRVLAAGDCFIEVLTPLTNDSAGHRYLERHGAGGYMAIFQFRQRDDRLRRVAELGIRIVWQADLPDIAGAHLDPRDVPGAIVSLDWAEPPWSWHWAGPQWRADSPTAPAPPFVSPGGLTSLTVAVADPPAAAARWADVLGDGVVLDAASIALADAGQAIAFVDSAELGREGIVRCGLALSLGDERPATFSTEIGGVRFALSPPSRSPRSVSHDDE